MKDFIYDGSVRILYGAGQMETVVQETAKLGKHVLLAADPQDYAKLTEIIDSFGPMPCRILPLTTERMAKMIEDAIVGRTD